MDTGSETYFMKLGSYVYCTKSDSYSKVAYKTLNREEDNILIQKKYQCNINHC